MLIGCNSSHKTGTSQGRPIIGPFRAKDENPLWQRNNQKQSTQQQIVQLSVYTIWLGQEENKKLDELWALAGPARLAKDNASLLAGNGLQIAAGNIATWAKAVELVKAGPGTQEQSRSGKVQTTWLAEGLVAELPLGGAVSSLTLFRHEPDGQLAGQTYQECRRLLLSSAAARPNGQVELRMTPALKQDPARRRALHRLGVPGEIEPDVYLARFELLAFDVLVNPEEFLIIGSAGATDEASFGKAFFDSDDSRPPAKRLLLIIPRILPNEPGNRAAELQEAQQSQ